MAQTTANSANIIKQQIYGEMLQESFKDNLLGMIGLNDLTAEFPQGDTFNVDQIGQATVSDYSENATIDFSAIDTSRITLSLTDYVQDAFYVTDKLKMDAAGRADRMFATRVKESLYAFGKRMEGDLYSAANSTQTAADTNSINGQPHRIALPSGFTAQNVVDTRLVTSADYKATILSNFPQVNDCNVWSGDQNVPIDYGAVYVSLNFPATTNQTTKDIVKANIVTNFTDNLSVVSMTTKFTDPTDVYLELNTQFDFDPAKSGTTLTGTETGVYNYVVNYFNRNLNSFNTIFRRSNLLTEIDALDQAILSSRIDVKVQLRIEPTVGVEQNFELSYPMKITFPDDEIYSVTSGIFEFNGAVCQIKNELNGTRLQIIDINNNVLLDNVGEFKPLDGEVNIIGFAPDAFIGGNQYIKISVIPDNPSVIKPLRNYVLRLDTSESSATATIDRQTTSLQVT